MGEESIDTPRIRFPRSGRKTRCDIGVQVTLGDNGPRLEALARKMGLTDPGILVSTIVEYGLDRIESGATTLRFAVEGGKAA